MSAVPTDEIYERYLRKAIGEINELWEELGSYADSLHVPVLALAGAALEALPRRPFADALHDDNKQLWLCVQPGQELDYIDIDALRPDHLGCYGYHRNTHRISNLDDARADRCDHRLWSCRGWLTSEFWRARQRFRSSIAA